MSLLCRTLVSPMQKWTLFVAREVGCEGEGGAFGLLGEVEHDVGHDAFHDGA